MKILNLFSKIALPVLVGCFTLACNMTPEEGAKEKGEVLKEDVEDDEDIKNDDA